MVCDYVKTLHARYKKRIGGSSESEYLQDLCKRYLEAYEPGLDSEHSIFAVEAERITRIQTSMKAFQDEILNTAGYGVEYRYGEDASREMDNLCIAIYELESETILDVEDFARMFRAGLLPFQKA